MQAGRDSGGSIRLRAPCIVCMQAMVCGFHHQYCCSHHHAGNGITTSRIPLVTKALWNTLAEYSLADDIVVCPVENPSLSVFHESKRRNTEVLEAGGTSVLWNSWLSSFLFLSRRHGWPFPQCVHREDPPRLGAWVHVDTIECYHGAVA